MKIMIKEDWTLRLWLKNRIEDRDKLKKEKMRKKWLRDSGNETMTKRETLWITED
jgi:hypothetical protein